MCFSRLGLPSHRAFCTSAYRLGLSLLVGTTFVHAISISLGVGQGFLAEVSVYRCRVPDVEGSESEAVYRVRPLLNASEKYLNLVQFPDTQVFPPDGNMIREKKAKEFL